MSSYALPQLKSRLRIDTSGVTADVASLRSQLQTEIGAAGSAAFEGLSATIAATTGRTTELRAGLALVGETGRTSFEGISSAVAAATVRLEALKVATNNLRMDEAARAAQLSVGGVTEGVVLLHDEANKPQPEAFQGIRTALATAKEQTDGLIERIGVLGETASKVGGAVGVEGGGGIFGSVGGVLGALGPLAVLGGIAALGAGLEDITTKTANYSSAVLRNSELLGINTEQYQGLYYAVHQFGIEHEDLTRSLVMFQRQIEQGAPTLRQMGLSLQDVGITSTDTGTAINQLSTFLQNNTDEAQRNAVGIALLGRNGVALTEVLSKGPAFLAAYTDQLKQFGLVLDDNSLQSGAAAKAIHDQMDLALQGVEMQVGSRLEGAFTALWETIIEGSTKSKSAIAGISDVIANVVGAIASFVQGLFGIDTGSFFDDLNKNLHSPATALAGLGNSAQDASDSFDGLTGSVGASQAALDALRQSTQHQTDAIDDQIKALQDQQSAYDEQVQNEITAIQQREQAVQDQITDQRDLQAQQDATHQSYLSQLQDQLNALTHTQDDQRRSGESLVDYQRRMQEQQLQDQIQQEQDRREVVKTTQDLQLQQLKEQDQAETDELKAEQQRQKDLTDSQVAQLNKRKTDLQRHLQDIEAADQAANSKMAAGAAALSSSISSDMGAAGTNVQGVFDQMEIHANSTAKQIGADIRDIFQHPENFLPDAIKLGDILGEAIGSALVNGVGRKLSDFIMPWVTDPQHVTPWNPQSTAGGDMDPYVLDKNGQPITGTWQPNGDFIGTDGKTYKGGKPPGRALGGPVFASTAALSNASSILDTYMVGENGPEVGVFSRNGYVVSREDAMARLGGMMPSSDQGGDTYVANYYGPVADQLVARRVMDEWQAKKMRRAMSLRGRSG